MQSNIQIKTSKWCAFIDRWSLFRGVFDSTSNLLMKPASVAFFYENLYFVKVDESLINKMSMSF